MIARIGADDWARPTPCDEWSVRDIVNKMVASTITFTCFGRRSRPEPPLDLVHPAEMLGDDPLGRYLDELRQVPPTRGVLRGGSTAMRRRRSATSRRRPC